METQINGIQEKSEKLKVEVRIHIRHYSRRISELNGSDRSSKHSQRHSSSKKSLLPRYKEVMVLDTIPHVE